MLFKLRIAIPGDILSFSENRPAGKNTTKNNTRERKPWPLKPLFNNARHIKDRNQKPAGVVPDNPGDAVENIRTGAGPRRQAATPRRQAENDPRRVAIGHGPGRGPHRGYRPGRKSSAHSLPPGDNAYHRAGTMDANMKEAER